jgi:anti-anti-sigma factor
VGAHKALGRAGGRLHLVVTSDRVARLLSLTGLDEVLDVHRDRDAGLGTLAQRG